MRIQKLFVMLILSILIVSSFGSFGLVSHPIPRAYAGGPQPSQLVTDPSFNNGLSDWTVSPAGRWVVDTGEYHSAPKSVLPSLSPSHINQTLSSYLYVDRLDNISWWDAEGNGWILFDVFYTDGSSDEINCTYTPGGVFHQVILHQSDLIGQSGEGKCIQGIGFNSSDITEDYTRVDDVYVYGYVVSYDPTNYQENNDFGNYTYYAESFSNVTFTFWVRVDNFSSYCPIEIGETQDEVAIHPNDKSLKCYLWSNDTGLYFWTMTSDGTLWNQQKNASISLYTWYNVTYSYYTAASTEYGKCWINNALQWTFTTTTDAYNFSSALCGYWQSIYAGLGTGYPDYISLYFDDIVWKSTGYGGNPAFTLTDDFENGFNLANGCPNWEVTGSCELSTDYSHSGTHSVHIISPATPQGEYTHTWSVSPSSLTTPQVTVNGTTSSFSYSASSYAGTYNFNATSSFVEGSIHYGFDHWLINGTTTNTTNALSFYLDGNSTFQAYYVMQQYNYSWTVYPALSAAQITVNGTTSSFPYSLNDTQNTYVMNATSALMSGGTYYYFSTWLINGTAYSNSPTLTLYLDGNSTFQANYLAYIPTKPTGTTYYFRSDVQTVNNLTAFKLDTANTASMAESNLTDLAADLPVSWSFRVYILHYGGSSTELTSNYSAVITRYDISYGYLNATWTCPYTTLVTGVDAIKIEVYTKIGTSAWSLRKTYVSSQLSESAIIAGTWLFHIYTATSGSTISTFRFGDTSSADSWVTGLNFQNPQTPFIFSNLQITPTSCIQGTMLTFSGRLYYQGTMIAPPDGDYNIQVLLSGLNVGSNHTLTSGVWTVTASAPNSAGYYVYTCTATNTSSGVFQTVTVGYTLTISTDSGGSTDPSPGTYLENSGVDVQVTATALGNYSFDHWLLDSVTLNYSNPVTVTMTGNRTVQAFFISNQTDTTPPTFGAVTANTTGAGASVQLSCPVSDNVALNAYWWSWNNTGVMINQTVVSASGGSVNAVLTGSWNASIGNTVTVKIYANDTSNNRAVSSTYNFLLSDPIPPTLESISVNTTIAGSTALFSGLAADNMNVSGFMLQSNLTGSMVNTTWTAFSTFFNSTAAWANITATLPGIVGVTVQWQFYVNDSANNWAASGLVNTTLTSPGSSSLASITFYVGGGGLLYVNGSLTLDETNLNCTIGSTLSLACVPNAGYSFTDIFWTGGLSTTSPASYTVSTDDSIYVYFTSTSTGSNGGTTTQPTSIQVTITGHVSASPGQTVTFDLLLSWSGGAANLTISSITAGGAYSNWIVVADTLPETGSGGSMRIALKCTPDWSATVGSDSIPVTVTVQPIGGSATTASGSVSVDIVSNQQMGIIPFWSMLILIIFSAIIGSIGYVRRRRS